MNQWPVTMLLKAQFGRIVWPAFYFQQAVIINRTWAAQLLQQMPHQHICVPHWHRSSTWSKFEKRPLKLNNCGQGDLSVALGAAPGGISVAASDCGSCQSPHRSGFSALIKCTPCCHHRHGCLNASSNTCIYWNTCIYGDTPLGLR